MNHINVTLPNGTLIKNVPDNVTKAEFTDKINNNSDRFAGIPKGWELPLDAVGKPIVPTDPKMDALVKSSIAKGTVMTGVGLLGDILGASKGLYNIPQDTMDQLMSRIKDPNANQPLLNKLDSFVRGFDEVKALNLPPVLGMTSEAADEKLTEMGWDPVAEGTDAQKPVLEVSKGIGQVISPFPAAKIKLIGKTYKAIKDLNPKSVKILDNGVTEISVKDTYKLAGKKYTDQGTIYFKNGYVTDINGKALKVYHGTSNPALKTSKLNISGQERELMYFTDSMGYAQKFMAPKNQFPSIKFSKDSRLIEANVAFEKPFIINKFTFSSGLSEELKILASTIYNQLPNKFGNTLKSNAWRVQPRTIKVLKEKGYDGIIYSTKGRNFYMPFYDEAINVKRAIKLTGDAPRW
jgi:hypothetical protein